MVLGQKPEVLQKIRGVTDKSHTANFDQIAWKQIKPSVPISEPMFYSSQSDLTQIGGVTFIRNTVIALQRSGKEGQLWPPVTQPQYSEPSGHEDSPGKTFYVPYLLKKLSKSRLRDRFLGLFLVISEVLYSENSDFQDLRFLGDFYVFYHFVCHRYT